MKGRFPRLCYIGPPVEATVGGSALLYKLLQNYPRERLVLVELSPDPAKRYSRLNGANAVRIPVPRASVGPRSRTLYELTFLFGRTFWSRWFDKQLRGVEFDAVLAVIHGWQCEPAFGLSRMRRRPFHAVIHDHAVGALPIPRALAKLRIRRWKRLCQSAASRLCVSPYMAQAIEQLTGKHCDVLYPGLGPEEQLSTSEPPARRNPEGGLVFDYIGTLHPCYASLVQVLGRILSGHGHRLIIHSQHGESFMRQPDIVGIVNGDWVATDAVAATLRREADVLFLPMSFVPADRAVMSVGFPSKLAEYCAAGRPMLIWGPPYCSAVRWAKEHPGFAEIVETQSEQAVAQAIQRLSSDADYREKLGRRSLELARQYFSHEETFARFLEALGASAALNNDTTCTISSTSVGVPV